MAAAAGYQQGMDGSIDVVLSAAGKNEGSESDEGYGDVFHGLDNEFEGLEIKARELRFAGPERLAITCLEFGEASKSFEGNSNSVHDVKQLGTFAALASLSYVFWVVGGMEMIERLAYYGVKAVAALYATEASSTGGLGLTSNDFGTILLLAYKEPHQAERLERQQLIKEGKIKQGSLLVDAFHELKNPILVWYLVLFSAFRFTFNALFDVLPLHLRDWLDVGGKDWAVVVWRIRFERNILA